MGLNTKAIADMYCEDGPGTPESALMCPDCLLGVVPKQHSSTASTISTTSPLCWMF